MLDSPNILSLDHATMLTKVFDELRREEPVFKKLLEVVLHFGTKF